MRNKEVKLELGNEFFNFDLELIENSTLDFERKGSLSTQGYILENLAFHYDFDDFDSFLNPVTGNTYDYSYSYSTDNIINKRFLDLGGGFLQGNFKGIVPLRTAEGFTLNFWMKFDKNPEFTGLTVNSLHPNNEGIFFFMGTKSENTSGSTSNDVNGIGLYFNNNKLGYKNIIVRDNLSGGTMTGIKVGESPSIFTGSTVNNWTNITVVFKRNQKLDICCEDCDDPFVPEPVIIAECEEVPDFQKGKLIFYVNARPVFSTEIEEPIFRDLISETGTTIPHNLSIGGGTLGLIENVPGLFMEENFAGTFNGGISLATMYTRPLTVPEIIRNFYSLRDIYKREENFGGHKIIVNGNLTK